MRKLEPPGPPHTGCRGNEWFDGDTVWLGQHAWERIGLRASERFYLRCKRCKGTLKDWPYKRVPVPLPNAEDVRGILKGYVGGDA